jgi:hypothetical protein
MSVIEILLQNYEKKMKGKNMYSITFTRYK